MGNYAWSKVRSCVGIILEHFSASPPNSEMYAMAMKYSEMRINKCEWKVIIGKSLGRVWVVLSVAPKGKECRDINLNMMLGANTDIIVSSLFSLLLVGDSCYCYLWYSQDGWTEHEIRDLSRCVNRTDIAILLQCCGPNRGEQCE